jgi:glucokinase
MNVRVGLDIGGTKTAALVVEGSHPLSEVVRPTDTASPDGLVASIVATVEEALGQLRQPYKLLGVGAGIPGQVDPARGTVSMAVNLNLREPYPLRDALGQAIGVPVALENDVRAAALGAFHWAWQVEPVKSLAYLSIGTGISAGLVLDGQVYRGVHGMAGEIGHIPVDPIGPRCTCGAYGCLETLAAGPAIAARAAEVMPAANSHPWSTGEVYALAADDHPEAGRIVNQAAGYLCRAVYFLLMAYDVEKVVLGGGVTRAGEAFELPLRRAMDSLRADSPLAATMMPDEKVIVIPTTYNPGVIGAVYLADTPPPEDRQGGQ